MNDFDILVVLTHAVYFIRRSQDMILTYRLSVKVDDFPVAQHDSSIPKHTSV